MKRLIAFLLLAGASLAAVNDVKVPQQVLASPPTFADRLVPFQSAVSTTLASYVSGMGLGAEDSPTFTGVKANSLTSLTGQPLTLATLDSNANVVLDPHGTGSVNVSGGATVAFTGRLQETSAATRSYANAFDTYHQLTTEGTTSGASSNPVGIYITNRFAGSTNFTENVGMWNEVQLNGTAGTGNVLVYDSQSDLNSGASAVFFAHFSSDLRLNSTGGITGNLNAFQARAITKTSSGDVTGNIAGLRVQAGWSSAAASSISGVIVEDQTAPSALGTSVAFRSLVNSGSGKFGLFLSGSAPNYLAGVTGIGANISSSTNLVIGASTTGVSSLRIPHGTAPSSPVNGDIWTTTTGLYAQINGTTNATVLTGTANTFSAIQTFGAGLGFSTTIGIIGTTTNNSAAAGSVGEYVSAQRLLASALGIASTVATDITSLSLTAGDWDVGGTAFFIPAAGTTMTLYLGAISTVSATLPGSDSMAQTGFSIPFTGAGTGSSFVLPVFRLSLASTTTVYLVTRADFGVSTCTSFGNLWARRIR